MRNNYLNLTVMGLTLVIISLVTLDGNGVFQYLIAGAGLILSAFAAFRLLINEKKESGT